MKGKVSAKHCFSTPITETKQYKSTSVVGKEETKSNTIIITKKNTQRESKSICNDKVTVKEKSRGHSLSSSIRWRGRDVLCRCHNCGRQCGLPF